MPVNLNRPLPARTKPRPQILSPDNVGANYRLLVSTYEDTSTNAELAMALSRLIVSKRIGHRRGTLLFSTTNTPEAALGVKTPVDCSALYEKPSDVPPLLYRKSKAGRYIAVTALAELPAYCDPLLRTGLLNDIDNANQLSGSHMLGNPRGQAQKEVQTRLLTEATGFHARIGNVTLLDVPNPFNDSERSIPYDLDCSGILAGDSLVSAVSMSADLGEVRGIRAQYALGVLADMPLS